MRAFGRSWSWFTSVRSSASNRASKTMLAAAAASAKAGCRLGGRTCCAGRGNEAIADASDGLDGAWVLLIVAESSAQASDVYDEGVGPTAAALAPQGAVDLVRGQDPVGVDHQEAQQLVLAQRESDRPAVEGDLKGRGIQAQRATLDRRFQHADAVRTDGLQDGNQLVEPVGSRATGRGTGGKRRPCLVALPIADADHHRDLRPLGRDGSGVRRL